MNSSQGLRLRQRLGLAAPNDSVLILELIAVLVQVVYAVVLIAHVLQFEALRVHVSVRKLEVV